MVNWRPDNVDPRLKNRFINRGCSPITGDDSPLKQGHPLLINQGFINPGCPLVRMACCHLPTDRLSWRRSHRCVACGFSNSIYLNVAIILNHSHDKQLHFSSMQNFPLHLFPPSFFPVAHRSENGVRWCGISVSLLMPHREG